MSLIKVLLQWNLHRWSINFSIWAHPLLSLHPSVKTCQLLRSIFLFLLLSLSPSFSYHGASNRACIFLSSHLSVLARGAWVCYGKWAKASEVHFLECVCVCVCTCMYVFMCVCMYLCVCMYMCVGGGYTHMHKYGIEKKPWQFQWLSSWQILGQESHLKSIFLQYVKNISIYIHIYIHTH